MSWTSPVVRRGGRAVDLVRGLVLPLVAVAAITATADLRIPVGLPGHRGLIWLTLLVAVALTARLPGTVTAVGAVSTVLGIGLGSTTGDLRYLAAAILLDAALAIPAVRSHPALLAVAAAPIHIVAVVVGPLVGTVGGGDQLIGLGSGTGTRVVFHLAFGLAAGLLGWAAAAAWRLQERHGPPD